MEKRTVVVLSGCPAAGKTRLISRMAECVDLDFLQIDSILEGFGEFSAEIYHLAREELVRSVENWIQSGKVSWLVVEDTNHLKSLVKPFRVLCKAYSVCFAHLVLVVDREVALKRNESRARPVLVESFEKIFYQISTEKFFSDSLKANVEEICFDDIVNWIRNVKVPKSEVEKKICEQGFKHLLDCKTRKAIKGLLDGFTGDKKKYAKKLVEAKGKVLKGVKELNYSEYLAMTEYVLSELSNV